MGIKYVINDLLHALKVTFIAKLGTVKWNKNITKYVLNFGAKFRETVSVIINCCIVMPCTLYK